MHHDSQNDVFMNQEMCHVVNFFDNLSKTKYENNNNLIFGPFFEKYWFSYDENA